MKKYYITKTAMAKDIAAKINLGLQDIKSRLSRSDKPEIVYLDIQVEGEMQSIKFYKTPDKFL